MYGYIVSAPAKIILTGEHAVVFGKKAIASSLDLRTAFRVNLNTTDIIFKSSALDIDLSWTSDKFNVLLKEVSESISSSPREFNNDLRQQLHSLVDCSGPAKSAVLAFLYLYFYMAATDKKCLGIDVTVTCDIPVGAGLGSSAAFAVCLSTAFLLSRRRLNPPDDLEQWVELNCEEISHWSFQVEKIFHGNPSGIDNNVSLRGGVVVFQNGNIRHIPNATSLPILVVNTKVSRNTKDLVQRVKTLANEFPLIVGPILDAIESITNEVESLLSQADLPHHYIKLKKLLQLNHRLLCCLDVSHVSLEAVVKEAESLDLVAKLTGAGGGGCAFVLLPEGFHSASLQVQLQSLGYDCWTTNSGGRGLTAELVPS